MHQEGGCYAAPQLKLCDRLTPGFLRSPGANVVTPVSRAEDARGVRRYFVVVSPVSRAKMEKVKLL